MKQSTTMKKAEALKYRELVRAIRKIKIMAIRNATFLVTLFTIDDIQTQSGYFSVAIGKEPFLGGVITDNKYRFYLVHKKHTIIIEEESPQNFADMLFSVFNVGHQVKADVTLTMSEFLL